MHLHCPFFALFFHYLAFLMLQLSRLVGARQMPTIGVRIRVRRRGEDVRRRAVQVLSSLVPEAMKLVRQIQTSQIGPTQMIR